MIALQHSISLGSSLIKLLEICRGFHNTCTYTGHMRRITAPFLTLFVVYFFLQIPPAALAGHIVIDGWFTDWAAEACFSDPGLADDEASPARADITEFCSSAESGSLFMIMAWDDTRFQGGNASTAAVTTRGANDNYYRIYTTAGGVRAPRVWIACSSTPAVPTRRAPPGLRFVTTRMPTP